jgi:hypothetical protein
MSLRQMPTKSQPDTDAINTYLVQRKHVSLFLVEYVHVNAIERNNWFMLMSNFQSHPQSPMHVGQAQIAFLANGVKNATATTMNPGEFIISFVTGGHPENFVMCHLKIRPAPNP